MIIFFLEKLLLEKRGWIQEAGEADADLVTDGLLAYILGSVLWIKP